MTLRVYVAASSAPNEMTRAHRVSERLREAGIVVTSTWIENIAAVGDANPRDASKEQRAQWAESCLDGVYSCDLLLLLVPPTSAPTRGAWVEMGYALARHKPIIASGDTRQTVFAGLEEVDEAADDEQAIAEILAERFA